MKKEIDYWKFKTLIEAIIEKFFHSTNAPEKFKQYKHEIKLITQKRFFGSDDANPFPFGGVESGVTPNYKESLKSEFLKTSHIIQILKEDHDKKDTPNWYKYKKNENLGVLSHESPDLKKSNSNLYDEYKKVIKQTGITEAAFCFIAERYNGKTLQDWYSIFIKGENNYNKKAPKTIDSVNLNIYLAYVGWNEEKLIKETNQNSNSQIITYTGFYYNFLKHAVFENFKFKLNIANEPFRIEVEGLIYSLYKKYEGNGERIEEKLHIRLQELNNDKSHHYIYIILDWGQGVELREIIRGSFMGVTSEKGQTYNMEIILIKNIYNLAEGNKLNISRYLFWNRRDFRIKQEEIKPDKIQVEKYNVNQFQNIVGYWKTWRFDENFNVLESLFHINDDYKVQHHILNLNKKYSREYCSFKITQIKQGYILCSYSYINTEIADFFMIIVPEDKIQNLTFGVTISNKNKKGFPIKRALILKKEDEEHWKELSENELKEAIIERLNVYPLHRIYMELTNNKNSEFYKIFHSLSRKELSNNLPHWIISHLNFDEFYKE